MEPPTITKEVPSPANPDAELLGGVPAKPDYSPQFHVAVLYNSEPVAMEKVKNKHGCRIFTGMLLLQVQVAMSILLTTLNVSIGKRQCISLLSCRSFTETVEDADEQTHNENGFCHPDTQPIHLPSKHPHENGRTILSHMWQGIQIVAAENGDLFVTSHTNLRVYVRSLSSEEGVSVQTLGPGCRLKVFDYAAFKCHLASKAAEQNGCHQDPLSVLQELLSHCVILTLGQPVERVHPLAMNYVTVVLFLRRMVKKMEQYYRIQLMESVENHFDWVMSSSPCIEVVEDHRVDAQDRQSPASSATQ